MSNKKQQTKTVRTSKKNVETRGPLKGLPRTGEQKMIPLSQIDISPLNYRKFYNEQALKHFAKGLKIHGIISPLTVRQMPSSRYEVIVGERRYRAGKIAGLAEVPVVIKQLTDEEVREMQLMENIEREDPHPLHESFAILDMQQRGKSLDEIAARLVKSKAFIYSRLKLATLVEAFQEMFLADKLTIGEAVDIAQLTAESQQELYDQYCTGWQEEPHWAFSSLSNLLSRFRYNLKRASFDLADKELLPEAGACTGCAFNSATLSSLFPETEDKAVCSNRECYRRKCTAQGHRELKDAFAKEWPDALIFEGEPDDSIVELLTGIEGALNLPHYSYYDIETWEPPALPEKEEFLEDDDESAFDEEGFGQAVEEYNREMEAFQALVQRGGVQKGLLITAHQIQHLLFSPERRRYQPVSIPTVSAKTVQEAIKAKKATPKLIEGEMTRLKEREQRAKEIDLEKIQASLHEAFAAFILVSDNNKLTTDDITATRLLIYDSLDYNARSEVNRHLFPDDALNGTGREQDFLEKIATLTEEQHCFLVRKALLSKSESKYPPAHAAARCLYQLAVSAGMDVTEIEKAQVQIAATRAKKMEERLAQLQKLLEKLKVKTAQSETVN